MKRKLTLTLTTSLMMFPQVVETIYSPALTDISGGFHVSPETAAQTLSFYFFAFAAGVVIWGRLCDVIGRRPAILLGLSLYMCASVIAVFCDTFTVLLLARILSAFGAAVGSVGTQTAMRDCYDGHELTRIFSIMGIAMGVSPAIGLLSGSLLTYYWNYHGVFAGLAALSALLLSYTMMKLPETRPAHIEQSTFLKTLIRMLKDNDIWHNALLIALFNICMFSYYQIGPFYFKSLALPQQWFGYTGFILAFGIIIGAIMNKHLVTRKWKFSSLLITACFLSISGGILVILFENSVWFVFSMILVVMAYSTAIPNVLAQALRHYRDCAGTAGAILGLMYYLMLGGGLVISGLSQRLGIILTLSSISALIIAQFIVSSENQSQVKELTDN